MGSIERAMPCTSVFSLAADVRWDETNKIHQFVILDNRFDNEIGAKKLGARPK